MKKLIRLIIVSITMIPYATASDVANNMLLLRSAAKANPTAHPLPATLKQKLQILQKQVAQETNPDRIKQLMDQIQALKKQLEQATGRKAVMPRS
jgi:hypothetical protein